MANHNGRHTLLVPQHPDYLAYNRDALSDNWTERLRGFQNMIPAGEPFEAWISTLFRLDFKRNQILDVEPAGLTTRWPEHPADVSLRDVGALRFWNAVSARPHQSIPNLRSA
jgi:hypothetical protein